MAAELHESSLPAICYIITFPSPWESWWYIFFSRDESERFAFSPLLPVRYVFTFFSFFFHVFRDKVDVMAYHYEISICNGYRAIYKRMKYITNVGVTEYLRMIDQFYDINVSSRSGYTTRVLNISNIL